MKKTFVLNLIVTGFALALAACGSSSNGTNNNPNGYYSNGYGYAYSGNGAGYSGPIQVTNSSLAKSIMNNSYGTSSFGCFMSFGQNCLGSSGQSSLQISVNQQTGFVVNMYLYGRPLQSGRANYIPSGSGGDVSFQTMGGGMFYNVDINSPNMPLDGSVAPTNAQTPATVNINGQPIGTALLYRSF